MPPSNCFRTGRSSLTQSSVKAVHGQDSKWMSGSVYHRDRRREARTRAEGPEKPVLRAPPERVRRAFALLTTTHHGGRLTGHLPRLIWGRFHFSPKRVNQASLLPGGMPHGHSH